MAISFRYDRGFGNEILRELGFREAIGDIADEIADHAQSIARSEAYDEGDYHDGIEATVDTGDFNTPARVNANDWKSHWIEWGYQGSPGKAPLRRAAQEVVGSTNLRGS
jgi:hypothetical protein